MGENLTICSAFLQNGVPAVVIRLLRRCLHENYRQRETPFPHGVPLWSEPANVSPEPRVHRDSPVREHLMLLS